MSSASTFDEPVIDYDELAGSDDIGTYPIDPSPSSLLPSGVSVETVARLMHDELLHNAEFAKQVRLVAVLQELLEFHSKTTPNASVVSPLRPDCSTRQVRVNSGDLPLPHPRPTICPAHYPEKVLWTLADCKVDTEVNASPSNLSRPPMLRAIHREDGTLVNDDDWKAMRQSAVLIVRTCILPLDVTPYYKYFTEQVEKSNAKGAKKSGKKPGESTTQQAKVKKTFYKHFFFKEWFAALQELESAVPLMSLCARYWKANMTLGSALPDIRVDLPTPATSHVGTSSCAATPSNASRAPHSQSSVSPPACSQSSRPPPTPRSQSSMPPPAPHDQQTSRTTRAKSAMQAGDRATSGEEAGADNVAARQWESSPLPPSHPTTPKPKLNPTTIPRQQQWGDEGDKHGGGKSGSGNDNDGNGNGDGLLATLKRDDLIAWITAHDIEPQGKRATKKEIIKAIMAAAKSEHPSKEDVEEIIELRQAKRNTRTA
ncbi:hypothetical protein EDB85DRAFT_2165335 [Lactarius pseudohatsudake]|nr:hypothetical protein EDB85DRAFT_2165335 [Lactarius pseudohatsudake]